MHVFGRVVVFTPVAIVHQMAPEMLHDLASLFGAGPQEQPVLAWRAISILRSAVSALQTMAGAAAARVKEVLPPVLGEWMPILLAVLSAPWTVRDFCFIVGCY